VNRLPSPLNMLPLLGGATVWPLPLRAQQPVMPVIGFIRDGTADGNPRNVAGFRKGLSETGYTEGENVLIEYRWLEGQYDRLPGLLADLIRRQVSVIATPGNVPTRAAKEATASIPIVFGVGEDPVELGIVASLTKPGGNATGINFLVGELTAKRLRLLHDMVPAAVRIAVLLNPGNTVVTESTLREVQKAAHGTSNPAGQSNHDPRNRRRINLYRRAAGYVDRILKGEKPADMPVQARTKDELVINLKTAKALGLSVPMSLLGRADELIE
jgi:ABC-type uncharacterized transport system substrate-binding protein